MFCSSGSRHCKFKNIDSHRQIQNNNSSDQQTFFEIDNILKFFLFCLSFYKGKHKNITYHSENTVNKAINEPLYSFGRNQKRSLQSKKFEKQNSKRSSHTICFQRVLKFKTSYDKILLFVSEKIHSRSTFRVARDRHRLHLI